MGGRVTKQSYAMAREPRKIESNVSLLRPRYQEMHMCASNGATVRSGAPFAFHSGIAVGCGYA